MRFCGQHFRSLYETIQKKGMRAMCSTEQEVIGKRMQSWLQGTMMRHEFDPMVGSILEIGDKARRLMIEIPLLHPPECPLCIVRQILGEDAPRSWIDNCTDAMVVICEKNHLRRH